jgi:hypothetical protein
MKGSAHPVACREGTPELGHLIVAALAELRRGVFGSYRPERHYMRGPGPKWHAKHAAPGLQAGPDIACAMAFAPVRARQRTW